MISVPVFQPVHHVKLEPHVGGESYQSLNTYLMRCISFSSYKHAAKQGPMAFDCNNTATRVC
jgi:hypothetical protein